MEHYHHKIQARVNSNLAPTPVRGDFYTHYKKPNVIYQIIGVAQTDDLCSTPDFGVRPIDFYALNADDKAHHYGYIYHPDTITISAHWEDYSLGQSYVVYRALKPLDSPIWVRKTVDFCAMIQTEDCWCERFKIVGTASECPRCGG